MQDAFLRHLGRNAIAYVALFVALGGTSFAAATVITGKNVKNSSLTGVDVKNSSLTGTDVKDKSLSPGDFNGSVTGPKGDTGAQGPKGDTGAQGPKGDTGTVDTSGIYTKTESDARYLAANGKAADADQLDGIDSSGLVRGPGNPNVWTYRRDWARNNTLVHDLPDIPGVGQLAFTCQQPNNTGPGVLSFRNTSNASLESFATTTTATGSTLARLTTAPGTTTTLDLGSGASQVVWQIGPLTYFNAGPLATVTVSHVTDVTQCRVSALAHYQDPRRF